MNFANQLAAIAAPVITGYLIGSKSDFARAYFAAAVALIIGIAEYVFLLGRITRVSAPTDEVRVR